MKYFFPFTTLLGLTAAVPETLAQVTRVPPGGQAPVPLVARSPKVSREIPSTRCYTVGPLIQRLIMISQTDEAVQSKLMPQ